MSLPLLNVLLALNSETMYFTILMLSLYILLQLGKSDCNPYVVSTTVLYLLVRLSRVNKIYSFIYDLLII